MSHTISKRAATTIDLDDQAVAALTQLREAFDACWRGNEFAANGAVVLLTELAAAELRSLTPFTERQAYWLAAHTMGTMESPRMLGRLLHQDLADSIPDLGHPGAVLRQKVAALTVTQDWALRMAYATYHARRSENANTTFSEVGIPVLEG